MAKNKKNTMDRIFIVVTDSGIVCGEPDFEKAEKYAIKCCENADTDVMILEVIGAWSVEYPEEPMPESYKISLGNVV